MAYRGGGSGGGGRGGGFGEGGGRGSGPGIGRGDPRGGAVVRGGAPGHGGRGGERVVTATDLRNGALVCNYYPVHFKKQMAWFRYGLNFAGVQSRKLTRSLFSALLRHLFHDDYKRACLNFVQAGTAVFSVERFPGLAANQIVVIEVQEKKYDVSYTSVQEVGDTEVADQVYNEIIRRAMRGARALKKLGRHYFDTTSPVSLRPQLAKELLILPGITTEMSWKVIDQTRRLVLNVDTISKVISQKDALRAMRERIGPDARWDDPFVQKSLRRQFVSQAVYTVYNFQSYVIENIDFQANPRSTFEIQDFRSGDSYQITYAEYTSNFKKFIVSDMTQPLFVTRGRGREKIRLIPECCLIADIPDSARRELPLVCSVKPVDRFERIQRMAAVLKKEGDEPAKVLANFGLELEPSLIQLNARQLPPPMIEMPGMNAIPGGRSWGMQTQRITYAKDMYRFKVVIYVSFDDVQWCRNWAMQLTGDVMQVLRASNSPIDVLGSTDISVPARTSHAEAIRQRVHDKPPPENHVPLVLCFLENGDARQYAAVKKWTHEMGVHSQCVNLGKHKGKENKMEVIKYNLARQIVNKHGVLSWTARLGGAAPSLRNQIVLFVGIDVFHARKVYDRGNDLYRQRRSLGAFIGLLYHEPSAQFKTTCRTVVQKAREELFFRGEGTSQTGGSETANSDALEVPIATAGNALHDFIRDTAAHHGVNPTTVIVYRDGVGGTQFDQVVREEVPQVSAALPDAHVTYTVVQKRISTRFLMNVGGQIQNPPAGTVISTLKTPGLTDFYLIPTSTSLSTVRPVRYALLAHDEKHLPVQQLQAVTNAMCYLYANWTDSVKIPFPTQCAHKMAYLLGDMGDLDPVIHRRLFPSFFYL